MDKRFKPILAAAVAAGLFPNIVPIGHSNQVYGAAIATFTFENTSTIATGSSYGFTAEAGLATLTLAKTNATSTNNPTYSPGNGSPEALASANVVGASLTFAFSLDGASGIGISFDQAISGSGPADYVVQYSINGSAFSSFTNYVASSSVNGTATNTNGTTAGATAAGFATGASNNGFNYSFNITALIDPNLASGDFADIRILQSGATNGSGGALSGTSGTFRFDNVVISGAVPEPGSVAIMTLASAAAMLRRRRQA
ncbi:MAG TPA: PEP-CTERM sorting domain-containing protein [Tepidisphaeraceae bacterium]|nr:PEP-CTERM sorting domain-containing protein [Tepidisphaeraceae bacterium]